MKLIFAHHCWQNMLLKIYVTPYTTVFWKIKILFYSKRINYKYVHVQWAVLSLKASSSRQPLDGHNEEEMESIFPNRVHN